jgi:hypothetical protein
MLRQFIALGGIIAATGVAADPVALTSQALKESVTGSMIELDTPLGTKIPIRFSEDGLLSGEAGEMAAVLGAAKDRGRWWVADDRLCYKWFRWFDAESHCLQIHQDGTRINWRQDDGKTGTATIASRSPPAVTPQAETIAVRVQKPESETAAKDNPPPIMFAGMAPSLLPEPEKFTLQATPAAVAAPAAQSQVPETQVEAKSEPAPPQAPQVVTAAASPKAAPIKFAKPAAAKISSISLQPSFRVAGVEQNDVLNVRSAPSSESAPVGVIPPEGRGLKITGPCLEEWCPIKHRGVSGWVNRIYLAEELARPGSNPAQAAGRSDRH